MDNYHKRNRVEDYKHLVVLCSAAILLSTLVTIYVVNRAFGRTRAAITSTFVYSPTQGASIHVYSKEEDLWKTY